MGMFSADTYTGCVSEDAVTVCFGEEGSMEISADKPTMVNIVLKTGQEECFISYMADILVSRNPCKAELQERELLIDTDCQREIKISVITESGTEEKLSLPSILKKSTFKDRRL